MIEVTSAASIRREVAEREALKAESFCEAVLVVGSVAYGPHIVSDESDLDLVFIVSEGRELDPIDSGFIREDVPPKRLLRNREIDIWDHTNNENGFQVNYIFWTSAFFQQVVTQLGTESYFANRYSRRVPNPKQFFNFDHDSITHLYSPTVIEDGMILDFPVHLIKDQTYWAGIPVEQLLSVPSILYNRNDKWAAGNIEMLVKGLLGKATSEGKTHLALKNLLLRRDRFSESSEIAFHSLISRCLLSIV